MRTPERNCRLQLKSRQRPAAVRSALGYLRGAAIAGTLLLLFCGLSAAAIQPSVWKLDPRNVGMAADALRLPERAFPSQNSRGWQLRALPPGAAGESGLLAASDGVVWNPELRALVKREGEAAPFVGLVYR